MRLEGWRLRGAVATLSVAMAVLAFAVVSRADDEKRGARNSGPTSTGPLPSGETADTHLSIQGVDTRIRWRRSKAMGEPWSGRLVRGVKLPPEGRCSSPGTRSGTRHPTAPTGASQRVVCSERLSEFSDLTRRNIRTRRGWASGISADATVEVSANALAVSVTLPIRTAWTSTSTTLAEMGANANRGSRPR